VRLATGLVLSLLGGPAAAQAPSVWRLGPARLEIGGDGGVELHRVRGAVLLGDGRVAIADAGNSRVVVLNPDGTIAKAFGRAGAGPNEFGNLWKLTQAGDTLLTYDPGNVRVAAWLPDGTLLRTTSVSLRDAAVSEFRAAISAFDYLVTGKPDRGSGPSALQHDTLTVARLNATTRASTELGRRLWTYTFRYVEPGGGASTGYRTPFLGETLLAVAAGTIVTVPLGAATVELQRPDGAAVASVAIPVTSPPFDRSAIDHYRDSLLALVARDGPDPRQEARLKAVFGSTFPLPRDRALVEDIRTVGGAVWMRVFPTGPGRSITWFVLDVARARIVSRVELPRGWRVLGGDDGRVLILKRDGLGVEVVAVHDLVR
jgi:hypothetical protein